MATTTKWLPLRRRSANCKLADMGARANHKILGGSKPSALLWCVKTVVSSWMLPAEKKGDAFWALFQYGGSKSGLALSFGDQMLWERMKWAPRNTLIGTNIGDHGVRKHP